jgi:hypothetical protein
MPDVPIADYWIRCNFPSVYQLFNPKTVRISLEDALW